MLAKVFLWLFFAILLVVSIYLIQNKGEVFFPLQTDPQKQQAFSIRVKNFGFIFLFIAILLAGTLLFLEPIIALLAVLVACIVTAAFTFHVLSFIK